MKTDSSYTTSALREELSGSHDLSNAKDGKITIESHDLRRLLYGLDMECVLKKRSFICM